MWKRPRRDGDGMAALGAERGDDEEVWILGWRDDSAQGRREGTRGKKTRLTAGKERTFPDISGPFCQFAAPHGRIADTPTDEMGRGRVDLFSGGLLMTE